ncbi:MAG: DEAD/DEAH box helicase [Calditrichaeota bacterium]|nr:MAG: hypothetical protein DWQ03_12715 [Calditrichota bacterium]MBL1206105.1 DEAD/DEAH box helicase [Calditrichota bacterium]NOG45931.1 DEAD/DEAH box helicase [Calditrichota bacterium]
MLENFSFHPIIQSWFSQNFNKPSPPQIQGWPSIASGKNTLICAPTGSGKTLAAFLWCIDSLLREKINETGNPFSPLRMNNSSSLSEKNGVHTLYISPLKALNNDIERNLQFPLKGITEAAQKSNLEIPEISTLVRTGDTPANQRAKMLKTPPDILITTPESLYLLLTNQKGRMLFEGLRYIIVDEIHALCPNKRGVHLSLSLERLMPLCKNEPVRIGLSATQKPLDRIARYLGGQTYLPKFPDFQEDEKKPESVIPAGLKRESESFDKQLPIRTLGNDNKEVIKRPVNIIDTGQRKEMDLKVISPVKNYSDLPESSIWPEVYKLLYDLIMDHRTALVFAGMRSQTEKIARILNTIHQKETGDENARIALAHHGSLSRETRYDIEVKLKNGLIPAVIATGSLELGIDIGSIDLVVQLESPKTVSGALQRVGRSGHLIHATSKGRIIPLYRADLDDCAALTNAMLERKIEETKIPENALDVLAQHIVAEVSMQEWNFEDLFNLIRQSYCYHDLSKNAFQRVVEMLAGKIGNSTSQALYPRINWDSVNNKLIPRRGSQLTAVMNGGTIPDRAYYAVYLNGQNIRLGEMEEEFVFESRIGHIFYLGNTEYRIDDIQQDRIIVSLHSEANPKAPFWKGDLLYRDFKTNLNIGHFRGELLNQIKTGNAEKWLEEKFYTDENINRNLIDSINLQINHAGTLATDSQIILEKFIDAGGEPMLLIQAPFGARVTGLWALAIAGILENKHDKQVQYTYDDDALIIRLTNSENMPDLQEILNLSNMEIEKILFHKLIESPLFSVHFRYNAARALMLPRSQPRKRIPLWLQRLRAADLLQEVRQIPDFPIIAETYREVLYDLFDWPALQEVLEKINNGDIAFKMLNSSQPSPMTAGLLFRMISDNMYEYDRSRAANDGTINFTQLLADIIKREHIPQVVTGKINKSFSAKLQYLDINFAVNDTETLFSLIEKLGPITMQALKQRVTKNVLEKLDILRENGRIVLIEKPLHGWIAVTHQNDYQENWTSKGLENHVIRLLQNNGVLKQNELSLLCNADEQTMQEIIETLLKKELIVQGKLLKNSTKVYVCDRYNFARMYRQAIASRRKSVKPASLKDLNQFMLSWHFGTEKITDFETMMGTYLGAEFKSGFLKESILPSRQDKESFEKFQQQISTGKVIARVQQSGAKQIRETFIARQSGHYFWNPDDFTDEGPTENEKTIITFLKENGASFFNDICDATELKTQSVSISLGKLLKRGMISSDNYNAIQSSISNKKNVSENQNQLGGFSGRVRRQSRSASFVEFKKKEQLKQGRWFLINSFSVMGKKRSSEEKAIFQARMLLDRYGILIKEWYRHESGLLPWINIFNALKKLEWQGEIRRGYFIEGLSGLQFALPKALQILQTSKGQQNITSLISTTDPALPFGGTVNWALTDQDKNDIKVTRKTTNHIFVNKNRFAAYLENNATRIVLTSQWEKEDISLFLVALKNHFKQAGKFGLKKLEIKEINNRPAIICQFVNNFLETGFEKDGDILVLWPSGI